MRTLTKCVFAAILTTASTFASTCTTNPLSTYLNSGNTLTCAEGNLTYTFNPDDSFPIPSYLGLNLLSSNNSAALPGGITVTPSLAGLNFTSPNFTEAPLLGVAGAQTELVQFAVTSSAGPITDTDFSLQGVSLSAGSLNLGAGVAVGQELVCVGGLFNSLPTGLITSVTNGLLSTGAFGCNGVALVGTVGDSAGLLSDLNGLLGLPNLTGLGDSVDIQLAPYNAQTIDVIKIQALVGAAGGSASTTGFGDTFTAAAATQAPEPGSAGTLLGGILLIAGGYLVRQRARARRSASLRKWNASESEDERSSWAASC